jgi:hypothetical protein
MAAIVRVLCTVLYSTGAVGDKPNRCKRGYGIARHSHPTGPGNQQLISSAVLFLHVLRDSMSSRRRLVAAVTQVSTV